MNKFWLSKTFWINFLMVSIMVDQMIQQWPGNHATWVFGEGVALAVFNYILNYLQKTTISLLKKVYPDWKNGITLYKNKMNQPK